MITVFYDGQCGLCRREIAHYQKIAPVGVFEWVDITKDSSSFEALGFSVSDGLKELHVRDYQGVIHKGVDSFIVIWRALKWWRVLAVLVSLPVVLPLARKLYTIFATWRFKRLGYGSCSLK